MPPFGGGHPTAIGAVGSSGREEPRASVAPASQAKTFGSVVRVPKPPVVVREVNVRVA